MANGLVELRMTFGSTRGLACNKTKWIGNLHKNWTQQLRSKNPATMAKLQKENNTQNKNNNGNRNRNKKNIEVKPVRVLRLMSCLLFIKKTNEFFDLSVRKAEHNLKIERRQLTICCFSVGLSGSPGTCWTAAVCLCLPWHWRECRSHGMSWWVWCQLLNIYLKCCSAYCLFRPFLLIKWQPPHSCLCTICIGIEISNACNEFDLFALVIRTQFLNRVK